MTNAQGSPVSHGDIFLAQCDLSSEAERGGLPYRLNLKSKDSLIVNSLESTSRAVFHMMYDAVEG